MSVTEFKKRSKKMYVFAGAIAVLLPAAIVCTAVGFKCQRLWKENQRLEQWKQELSCETGYVLTQEVVPGQKIGKEMLQKVTVYTGDKQYIKPVEARELIGMYAKDSFAAGTIMHTECVYEESEYESDMRTRTYTFMNINEGIKTGDYVDIRIAYPNGEDYIITNHKKVLDVYEASAQEESQEMPRQDSIRLNVTEEELLRIASAYVDTVYYAGANIYVIAYLDQFQKPASVNYPVNPDVYELLGWNPNAVGYTVSELELHNRTVLEEHLKDFLNEDVKGSVQNRLEQELIND